jgi:WD40 repeat protein/energy-coupling factor transporter ATP-binding protein EcfA2
MNEQRSESTATATIRTSRFDVFLSYNSRDKPSVERIAEKLKRAGLEPWLDSWCLTPGGNWQEELAEGLRASAACAVFVGPNDLGDWENQELAAALDRAAKEPTFRVFLVLLPGLAEPFDPTTLSPFVSTRTWVDLRQGIGDGRELQSLVNAVKGVPLGPEVPLEPREDVSPYRGLQRFDEEDAEFFFGRDGDVQRLLEKLKTTRFLAVLGPSGSGKSSLVRAGLLPALRRGAPPVGKEGLIAVLTPGSHPLTALAAQLLRLQPANGMQKTLDELRDDPRTLHLAGALALADRPESEQIVWVIDQFEEVFTLCRDEAERAQFFANLLYASSIPGGHATVVLTLRADFYYKCAAYPELSQRIAAQQFLVSPIDGDGLHQVIEEPARRVGLVFEEGLVATILEDVHNQPGGLPLLEHALLELWERRRGGMLTLEGYRESGGVAGAIAKRADEIYSGFTPEEQAIARRTLLRLTQPGEGTEDTRRRATLEELLPRTGEEEAVEGVLRALVDARMLTASADELTDGRWIDVSHEALIRGWPRLREWLDEDRAGLLVHRRLTEAAQEWKRHDRDESALYRGARLAEVIEWRSGNEEALNDDEREFVDASAALSTREKAASRRRVRFAIGGLATALVLIGAAAIYALHQSRIATDQRELAFSRELVASANTQLSADPELSLLLGLEALNHARTPEAFDVLERALPEFQKYIGLRGEGAALRSVAFSRTGEFVVTASEEPDNTARVWNVATRDFVDLRGHDGPVTRAAFSPNGRLVVTASEDKSARVWNAESGKQLGPSLEHGHEVRRLAFNRDGSVIATTSDDGIVHLWELATRKDRVLRGHEVPEEDEEEVPIRGLEFSQDFEFLATGSDDQTARIWNLTTGESVELRGHSDAVRDVAFSPNGRLVVTASDDGDARVWDAESGKNKQVLRGHKDVVEEVDFSPDGKHIATASDDKTARVWNTAGDEVALLLGHTDIVEAVEFSPDGELVVTAGEDGTARIWSARSGEELAVLRGHTADVRRAHFSPLGGRVVTASDDGTARVWTPRLYPILRGNSGGLGNVAFSLDGERLTAASDEGAAMWEVATRKPVGGLSGRESESVSLSTDGRLLVTGHEGGWAEVWDIETDQLVARLPGDRPMQERPVQAVTLSSDGRLLATAPEEASAEVWDIETERATRLSRGEAEAVALSSDGRLLATTREDASAEVWEIEVWEIETSELVARRRVHGQLVEAVAFSPDNRSLATASQDDTACVWNLRRLSEAMCFTGHADDVESVAFSPDGQFVVTGGDDRMARVWRTTTGDEVAVFRGPTDDVEDAVFSKDGRFVATASADGAARSYRCDVCVPIDQLPELAHEAVTRELTPHEQELYLHE